MLLTAVATAAAAAAAGSFETRRHTCSPLNTGLHQCVRLSVAFLFYFALTNIHFRFHFDRFLCAICYDQSVIVVLFLLFYFSVLPPLSF